VYRSHDVSDRNFQKKVSICLLQMCIAEFYSGMPDPVPAEADTIVPPSGSGHRTVFELPLVLPTILMLFNSDSLPLRKIRQVIGHEPTLDAAISHVELIPARTTCPCSATQVARPSRHISPV